MASVPPYVSLEQQDTESEDVRNSRKRAQINTKSLSGSEQPVSKYQFDIIEIVASAAFILVASACIAFAVVLSTNQYTESKLSDSDYVSKLDCSVFQNDPIYLTGNLMLAVLGEIVTSTTDPGTVHQIERTFTLDLKTAPTLS